MADTSGRPLRGCNQCGGYDTDPRHVQQLGGRTVMAHMDCCAAAGCPTCAATETENGGRRGDELTAHLNTTRETTNG